MKVFWWSLKDERGWLLGWAAGVSGMVCFIIFLYPAMGEMMQSFLDKEVIVKAFIGRYGPQMMDRSYFDVWLCLEFFAWFGVLVGIYPLIYASNVVTAEVERRIMEMVLAQPVSRTRVLMEKFAALMVNLLVLCAAGFLALWAAAYIWVDEPASTLEYSYIFVNNYFLLFAIAAFGFFCAVLINEQRAALTVTIGAVLISFLAYKVLSGAGVAPWLTCLTPYCYADATKILATGKFNFGDSAVLALAGLTFLSAALALFQKKDLAT